MVKPHWCPNQMVTVVASHGLTWVNMVRYIFWSVWIFVVDQTFKDTLLEYIRCGQPYVIIPHINKHKSICVYYIKNFIIRTILTNDVIENQFVGPRQINLRSVYHLHTAPMNHKFDTHPAVTHNFIQKTSFFHMSFAIDLFPQNPW